MVIKRFTQKQIMSNIKDSVDQTIIIINKMWEFDKLSLIEKELVLEYLNSNQMEYKGSVGTTLKQALKNFILNNNA